MKNRSKFSQKALSKTLPKIALLFLVGILISCKAVKESATRFNQDDLVNYFSSTLETDHLKNPDHAFYQKSIALNDISTYRSSLWTAWKKANGGRSSWTLVSSVRTDGVYPCLAIWGFIRRC